MKGLSPALGKGASHPLAVVELITPEKLAKALAKELDAAKAELEKANKKLDDAVVDLDAIEVIYKKHLKNKDLDDTVAEVADYKEKKK